MVKDERKWRGFGSAKGHLKDLNSLNLVLGTKLVQNSDLVFSPRSKFSLKGLNLQD